MASKDVLPATAAPAFDSRKYHSPPPPASSMTPPPTSQAPILHARTPTPTHSHLSSPPPTVKAMSIKSPLHSVASMFSHDQVINATIDELQSMLAEIDAAYREARASAAHHILQYNLLAMERSEAMKRMDVELDMAHKEVEVLRDQSLRGITPILSNHTSPIQQVSSMRSQNELLELDNISLRRRNSDLIAIMLEREAALSEENERLRERIRENRKHMNLIHRSANIDDGSPLTAYATPRLTRDLVHETSKDAKEQPFAALLLADQVLSQEAATTPSTPQPGRARKGQFADQRGKYSLSSLPSTPTQARTAPAASRTVHPYYLGDTQSPLMPRSAPYRQRRQGSRDSTISASDLNVDERSEAGYSSIEEDVPESQASQEASNMLRKNSLRRSFGSAQPSHNPFTKTKGLSQTKLYGPVKKPGMESNKRKASSAINSKDRASKKGRADIFGLGIGGFVSPSK